MSFKFVFCKGEAAEPSFMQSNNSNLAPDLFLYIKIDEIQNTV